MKIWIALFALLLVAGCSTQEKSGGDGTSSETEEALQDSGQGLQSSESKPAEAPKAPEVSSYDLYKKYRDARVAKDYRAASQYASEILSRNPNDPKILNALATSAIESGKLDLARLILGKILYRDPNNSPALNNIGVVELKSDNLRLALINFKRAAAADARNKAALANLGAIYVQYRNYGAAVSALETAIDYGDQATDTMNNYAIALSGVGDKDRATKQFEKTLAKDQNNVNVMVNYAAHLIDRAGDSKKALGILNKVRFIAHEPAILERVNSLTRKAEAPSTATKGGDN